MRPIDADALLNGGIRVSRGFNDSDGVVMIPMGDVRQSIKNAPTINPWIRVTEQLPPEGCEVLAMVQSPDDESHATQKAVIAVYRRGKWTVGDVYDQFEAHTWDSDPDDDPVFFWITHWMPFPILPGAKQDE